MMDERQRANGVKAMVSSYGSVVPPTIQNISKATASSAKESAPIDMRDTVFVKDMKLSSTARNIFEAFGSLKHFDMDESREAAIAVVRLLSH